MSDESNWITSKELLKLWFADKSNGSRSPEHKLRPALRAGLITARAMLAELEVSSRYGGKTHYDTEWSVPKDVWKGTGENSHFDLRADTYGSRAPGTGYSAVALSGLSFEREQFIKFTNLSVASADQIPAISSHGTKPGPPLDSERWSDFAAGLAFVAYDVGLDKFPSRSKLYEAVAQKVNDKGGKPLDEKLVRRMLETARTWARESD